MLELIGCAALLVLGYLLWSWITTRNRYAGYKTDCRLCDITPDSFEEFVAYEARWGKYKVIG